MSSSIIVLFRGRVGLITIDQAGESMLEITVELGEDKPIVD